MSVFVSVPTSESKGGDSNPTALLTDYSGNHSLLSSDNLLPQEMISLYQRPSKAVPYSVRFPNPAFQPLSVRCFFVIVTKFLKNHQTHLIHPPSTPYNTKEMQYESSLFFTYFKKDRDAEAREPVKCKEKA